MFQAQRPLLLLQPAGQSLRELHPLQLQHPPFSIDPGASSLRVHKPPLRTWTRRGSGSPGESSGLSVEWDGRKREKWEKEVQLIRYLPPSATYYDSLPIKPGFFFIETLLSAPHASVTSLHLNLPKTLYYSNSLYMLWTGTPHTDEQGSIRIDRDAHVVKFLKMVETQKPTEISHVFDQVAVVLRAKSSPEGDMKKFVLDWSTFRQKILAHDIKQLTMLQEFVHSPSGKPSVLRLTYYVSTKSPRGNFAFLLSSTVHTNPHAGLLHKTVTDSSLPNGVEIFRQTGKSLRPYELQARNLVDFLQRGYRVRVEEIVLDFLKSPNGRVWLCGCKGFRLDPSTISPLSSLPPFDSVSPPEEPRPKDSFVTCKLCRLQHANRDLPHLVSLKMLYIFQAHVLRRRKLPFEAGHLRAVSAELMSQSVRICACCFLVITAEHNLYDTELRLGRVMSIPMQEEDIFLARTQNPDLQFFPKELRQYRVLVQFISLETESLLGNGAPLFLHFQLINAKATYSLSKVEQKPDSRLYPIQALRLAYIFTPPDKPLKAFLSKANVVVSVTDSAVWGLGQTFASSSSPLLQCFPPSLAPRTALFTHLTFSLFSPSRKLHFPLDLGLGLSCDQVLNTERIQTALTRTFDGFMPEDCYFNTEPLPEEWMEAFGQRTEQDSFGPVENLEDAYSPQIQFADVQRMQDPTSPFPTPLPSCRSSKRSHSVSLLKPSILSTFPTAQPSSNTSRFEGRTDAKVVEVAEMVDCFLAGRQVAGGVLVPELDLRGKGEGEEEERTKRKTDRPKTARSSLRLHSGRSSTRSFSPLNLHSLLSSHLPGILPYSALPQH